MYYIFGTHRAVSKSSALLSADFSASALFGAVYRKLFAARSRISSIERACFPFFFFFDMNSASGETAKATMEIKNTNSYDVSNVKVQYKLPANFTLTSGRQFETSYILSLVHILNSVEKAGILCYYGHTENLKR